VGDNGTGEGGEEKLRISGGTIGGSGNREEKEPGGSESTHKSVLSTRQGCRRLESTIRSLLLSEVA
jgi:hypothetical protein